MTIKEMETLSGMARANIRFYEAEGFIAPARGENGYRNYSEADLAELMRIKLLRTLHVSLEDIKALRQGGGDLSALLDKHLAALEAEREDIETSRRVCQEMRRDAVSYATLDARKYLDSMDRPPEQVTAAVAKDVLPRIPWRRYLARSLDAALYSTPWILFLMLVCNVNFAHRGNGARFLDTVICMVLTLLLEPMLLHFWGTTPGKWLLGLYVTDTVGRKLSYSYALERTWTVLWRGQGLSIPVYGLIRSIKSYKACRDGETLDWEEYTTLHLRDRKPWRAIAYVAAVLASFGLLIFGIFQTTVPKHRGDLTPRAFCDNYNHYADYFKMDYTAGQDSAGNWRIVDGDLGLLGLTHHGTIAAPKLNFTLEDGVVTGVSFHYAADNVKVSAPSCQDQMQLIALSMSGSSGQRFTYAMRKALSDEISAHTFEDFTYSIGGLTVTCDVEYSGYDDRFTGSGVLLPIEGEKQHLTLDFTVTKTP